MKIVIIKSVLAAFIASALMSCDSALSSDTLGQDGSPINKEIRVRSDYRLETSDFNVTEDMALYYAKSCKREYKEISIQPIKKDGINVLYVVNFDDGWMVIPADKRIQPVVGEEETGHLNPETVENPGVKVWLDDLAATIAMVKEKGLDKYSEETVQMWTELHVYSDLENSQIRQQRDSDWVSSTWVKITNTTTTSVTYANTDHLISTKWGQSTPWNCSLPIDPGASAGDTTRFLTGCVPTAVAQLLYYYHDHDGTPNDLWHTITPSISGVNSDGSYSLSVSKSNHTNNSLRWSQMQLTIDDPPLIGDSTVNYDVFRYVSNLMLDIGVRMYAHYSTAFTGTALASPRYLSPCGISCQKTTYDYDIVRSNIVSGDPVLIVASKPGNSNYHAWIIDGCYDNTTTTTTTSTYYQYNPSANYPLNAVYLTEDEVYSAYPDAYDGMQIIESSYNNNTRYLLMNFGWDGDYDDGHYSILGTGWAQNYTNNKQIYYNIGTSQLN